MTLANGFLEGERKDKLAKVHVVVYQYHVPRSIILEADMMTTIGGL